MKERKLWIRRKDLPLGQKRIFYSQTAGKNPKYFIAGINGFGKKIEICDIPSPKVYLFRILPIINKKITDESIFRLIKKFNSLQDRVMKDPTTITSKLRKFIFKRDNWTCKMCGYKNNGIKDIVLHVDHIIPLSKGGSNNPDNLQTLCYKCNLKKRDKVENDT